MLGRAIPQSPVVKDAANLKNIGLACQIYSNGHNGRFPASSRK